MHLLLPMAIAAERVLLISATQAIKLTGLWI